MGNNPAMMVDPGGMQFQDMVNLPPRETLQLASAQFPTIRYGGPTFWLPSLGGAIDYGKGMTAGMIAYGNYLRNMAFWVSVGDESARIKNNNAVYQGRESYVSTYFDPKTEQYFFHLPLFRSWIDDAMQRGASNFFSQQKYGGDAWTRAYENGMMPYILKTPDAMAISIPIMITGISGLGISYNIGFVGKDLVHYYSFSTQLSTPDVSLGIGISWSYYTGRGAPSAENFFGYGRGGGLAVGPVSVSYSQGLSSYNGTPIWSNYQFNVGSPTIFNGYYAPFIKTNGWVIYSFK